MTISVYAHVKVSDTYVKMWFMVTLLNCAAVKTETGHGIGLRCDSGYYNCWNDRCIANNLRCDGTDHCGDNSDEAKCDNKKLTWVPFVAIPLAIVIGLWICHFVKMKKQYRTRNHPQINLAMATTDGTGYTPYSTQASNILQPFPDGYTWQASTLPPKYYPSDPPPAYSSVASEAGGQPLPGGVSSNIPTEHSTRI